MCGAIARSELGSDEACAACESRLPRCRSRERAFWPEKGNDAMGAHDTSETERERERDRARETDRANERASGRAREKERASERAGEGISN
eukprot:4150901-Pleurochrysis_carterae.AAC.1